MSLPNYSVVIPVYNAQNSIEKTITSVMAQTHKPSEIIVVDDCSTDRSVEILKQLAKNNPTITLFKNERNMGVAQTRNFAFNKVTQPFTALIDSDDYWESTKMQQQIGLMNSTGCDFSYTGYRLISEDNKIDKVYNVPTTISFKSMLSENVIGCSSVVLKTDIAQKYKMDSNYSHEDYVYWLNLLKDGKTAKGINKPLMLYTVSPNSRSGDKQNAAKNRWIVYRKFLKMGVLPSLFYFIQYALKAFIKHKK